MSTATITELGTNLRAWLAAVQVGDTVAIVDNGQEIARIIPPTKATRKPAADVKLNAWAQQRLDELNETFPEPVIGVMDELEDSRADICER